MRERGDTPGLARSRQPRRTTVGPAAHFALSVAVGCTAVACSGAPREAAAPESRDVANSSAALTLSAAQREQVVTRASAAIAPFKKQLSEALLGAMQRGGPVAAIDVCAEIAPRLAQEASSDDVEVGRSAIRLRNANNAPRSWLEPVLAELAQLPSPEGATRVVPIPGGHAGYVEAIALKPQCAVCHGNAVAPELTAAIRARYPQDRATGFEPGQLRGAFWADVKVSD